jgi:hypothetical protein
MTSVKMIPDGRDIAIFGEPANINYFVKTDLEAASEGSVENKQAKVKEHTRRRFVGDATPSNVDPHDRDFLFDPGRRNGSAVPGRIFVLDDGTERRQFHFTGSVMDLHAYLVAEASMDLTLVSPSASYDITAAGETAA